MSDEQNKDSPQSTSDNKQQEHQLNPPAIDKSIVQAEANTEAEKPTTYRSEIQTILRKWVRDKYNCENNYKIRCHKYGSHQNLHLLKYLRSNFVHSKVLDHQFRK